MTEQVLPEMGFTEREVGTVPALKQIEAGISEDMAKFLIDHAANDGNHSLIIAPRVGGRGGIGLRNLVTRYDPDAYSDGCVREWLWSVPSDKSAIHNNGKLISRWDIVFLLGDKNDPLDNSKPINTMDEPGLAYTGLDVDAQRRSLKEEKSQTKLLLMGAAVGHIVIDAAGIRSQGEPSRRGRARLIHYPKVPMHRNDYVPSVSRFDRRLRFDPSRDGYDWCDLGVHRVVRVPIKLEPQTFFP